MAEATGDVEKILEQFLIECLLDAVSPELRAWLKEQKPKTAEELGNLANMHVQSRKGPLVEGRYASFGKNKGDSFQKQPQIKREPPVFFLYFETLFTCELNKFTIINERNSPKR